MKKVFLTISTFITGLVIGGIAMAFDCPGFVHCVRSPLPEGVTTYLKLKQDNGKVSTPIFCADNQTVLKIPDTKKAKRTWRGVEYFNVFSCSSKQGPCKQIAKVPVTFASPGEDGIVRAQETTQIMYTDQQPYYVSCIPEPTNIYYRFK